MDYIDYRDIGKFLPASTKIWEEVLEASVKEGNEVWKFEGRYRIYTPYSFNPLFIVYPPSEDKTQQITVCKNRVTTEYLLPLFPVSFNRLRYNKGPNYSEYIKEGEATILNKELPNIQNIESL